MPHPFPRSLVVAVNFITLLVAGFCCSAGNFFHSASFFAWAGKNPGLHRLWVAGVLALFIGLLACARRGIAREEHSRVWLFRLWSFAGRIKSLWIVIILAAAAVLLTGAVNVARHNAFCSGFDLAIFDQALWNTLHGRFLWSSIKGHICLLGDHMSPMLLFYLPCFALWEDARVLLWAQAFLVGANGLLLYALCRQRWSKSALNWVFPLAYFLYLPVRNAAHFDFHPEMLADTLIFLSFLALHARKKAAFAACLAGLILCKETFWGLLFFYGLYLCFAPPPRRSVGAGISLCLASPLCFWAETAWLIPSISGKPYPYTGNYMAGGLAPLLAQAFSAGSVAYVVKIFAPLGFLSFASPVTLLLAGFGLLQNLFSLNPATHSIFFQYTIGLSPFVFLAAIEGIHRSDAWLGPTRHERVAIWILVWGILFSGVSEYYLYGFYRAQQTPQRDKIQSYLKTIPSGAIIKTNEFFAAHVAHRPYLYIPDDGGFWPFEKAASGSQEKLAVMGKGFGGGASLENISFLSKHGYKPLLSESDLIVMREETKHP